MLRGHARGLIGIIALIMVYVQFDFGIAGGRCELAGRWNSKSSIEIQHSPLSHRTPHTWLTDFPTHGSFACLHAPHPSCSHVWVSHEAPATGSWTGSGSLDELIDNLGQRLQPAWSGRPATIHGPAYEVADDTELADDASAPHLVSAQASNARQTLMPKVSCSPSRKQLVVSPHS